MLEGMLDNINKNNNDDQFELITKQQVMELLQISTSSITKLMKEIKYYKVGTIVRFNKQDVLNYIKKHEVN